MTFHGISTETLESVAEDMGIRLEPTRSNTGFVLRPKPGSDLWRNFRNGRRINACTWEAHYVFMERVLNVWPNGVIKSCLATYNGLRDFHNKAFSTRYSHGMSVNQ